MLSQKQSEALEIVAAGRFYPDLVREEDGWYARWRAVGVDNGWVDEYVRESAVTRLTEDAEDQRHETLHDAWMMALRSCTGLVRWDGAECAAFASELSEWHGGSDDQTAARAATEFVFGDFRVSCKAPVGRLAYKALGEAAHVFGPLRAMRSDGDGSLSVTLSRTDAEGFVKRGAKDLRDAGFSVVGCDISAPIAASAELTGDERADGRVVSRLTVRVAGEPVTAEEIRFLLDQGSSVVYFRGRLIEVDRNILKMALRALERQGGKPLSRAEALAFAFGIGHIGQLEVETAAAHGWLRGLVNELAKRKGDGRGARDDGRGEGLSITGFTGELRDYQRRGVKWLDFLTSHGFGALLADDMGLGKTVQTIAWTLLQRKEGKPFLIVAPLTLLSNWRHEFAAFAPKVRVYVHQGDSRHVASGFRRAALANDVVITSYTLLVKDYRDFSETEWAGIVLDEAQAMKNPDTQIAHAVKSLGVATRIALTGTPIENSVSDIWSLEDFLNPGFLGDRRSFTERFARPIVADADSSASGRLRHALEPFILRRLKSDRAIAGELGEKREIREYCQLAAEQRMEYEAALEDFRRSERRQGDVFALLTRLKLICDGEGKLVRLFELLEQVFAAGESALVFTQYAKVGHWLRREIERKFSRRTPFLHGALSPKARDREVAAFNRAGARAFVLSLKAGGYGLNLVKATHVIHFDRWWNPAVENQATDRAHRIGQTKTVFVHSFITEGTLEERVDEILSRKSQVAGELVTSGEAYLMKMAESELLDTVALG